MFANSAPARRVDVGIGGAPDDAAVVREEKVVAPEPHPAGEHEREDSQQC